MMRIAIAAVLLVCLPALLGAAPRRTYDPSEDFELLYDRLIKSPPQLTNGRPLPRGHTIGRCLFAVDGKTLISGNCAYRIFNDGGFHIDGPRQVYDGIDYPDAEGSIAAMMSTDYWANVFPEEDGTWNGYGNDWDIRGVNGQGPGFGALRRDGACWVNDRVRVCLWKK